MSQHISLRLAWHDDGWNGHVCSNPKENTYCVGQQSYPGDLIAQSRNLEWEEKDNVAGCHCSQVDGIPPCSYSINAFGTQSIKGESNPPDFFKDDSKGVQFEIPAATSCIWPYEQMYDDAILNTDPNSHQKYDYKKRLAAAKEFFSEVTPDQSLIFYYANKSNPFSEEDARNFAVVGVSRVKKLGDVMYYENVSDANKLKYADGFVWQLPITSHYPDEGFSIPYHKYRDNPEVLERITYIPEIAANFKYGTRHISDDDALIYVERLTEIVDYLSTFDKTDDWLVRKEWLISLQNELWSKRGPYPGLGSVLEHLEMPEFFVYYKEAVKKSNATEAKENIFNCLKDRNSKGIDDLDLEGIVIKDYQKKWLLKIESDTKREFIEKILCRIELKPQQVKLILAEDREKNSLYSSLDAFIDNPYIIQEEYVGNDYDDLINFEKIDHAVLPSLELGLDIIVEKDNWRRLRGLIVDALKHESVHTFTELESVIEKVNRKINPYPDWKNELFNAQYVDFDIKEFEKTLHFREREEIRYLYLKDIYNQERLIESQVRQIVGRIPIENKRPFTPEKWRNEIFEVDCDLNKKSPDDYQESIEDQVEVCQQIFNKPISVLSGAAGTGKTTVINAILKAIKHVSNNTEKCLLLAPTGKASDRLRESTGEEAQTIHQFLARKGWLNRNFTFKKEDGKKEDTITTFIIDETSMIDLTLMATLFKAINWDYVKRIILVGDPNQLPPIGRGKVFSDIIEFIKGVDDEAYGKLTANFRQMENKIDDKGTGIIDLASLYIQSNIRDNHSAKSDAEEVLNRINEDGSLDKDVDVIVWEDTEHLEKQLLEVVEKNMSENGDTDIMNYQVLSPYRGELFGTTHLNTLMQKALNENNSEKAPLGGVTYFDKVIQFTNRAGRNAYWGYNFDSKKNEKIEIFNGEMGKVWMDFRDKKKYHYINRVERFNVKFNRHDNFSISFSSENQVEENIELGYAISVHKSQGSEFNYLYLIIPQSKQTLLSTELIYTGITRAKVKLTVLVEKDLSILQTLRRPENSKLAFINSSLFKFEPLPQEFSNMDWYEEGKIHHTLSEYLVRSKSEVIISNLLVTNELESFKYEKLLTAPDGTFYLPDFTVNIKGKTYYWEHVGMLHLPKYKQRWEAKENWYNKHFPNQLLTTYEGENLTSEALKIIDKIKQS